MEGGGGGERFDLTRRRGGAEKDAEKKVERMSGIRAFRVRLAEAAEKTEVRRPMASGGGNEGFDWTRRRGGAEKDAEKNLERMSGIRVFRVWLAEAAENVSR
jgi:hypothetical protein